MRLQRRRQLGNAMVFPSLSGAVVYTLRDVKYDAGTATLIVSVAQAYTVVIIFSENIIL